MSQGMAVGRSRMIVTGRIIHADGTVTELGELRTTWRSWPVIRQIRKAFIMWQLRRRTRRNRSK